MAKAKKKKTTAKAPAALGTAKSDAQWQSECDARTLMEAEVIRKDRARVNKACRAAKKMVAEKMKEANAINAVAKGNIARKK